MDFVILLKEYICYILSFKSISCLQRMHGKMNTNIIKHTHTKHPHTHTHKGHAHAACTIHEHKTTSLKEKSENVSRW